MDLTPIANATTAWVTRAGNRWAAAALAINAGTYSGSDLARDLFRSWVEDPLTWYVDVSRETVTSRVLIPAQGLATKKSAVIAVPNPVQTRITSLFRLGGNDEMKVAAANPADIHVVLDRPATGGVQVTLQNLTGANHPPGQYVGFIYESQVLIAEVVVLR
jgi:hypothetical protein